MGPLHPLFSLLPIFFLSHLLLHTTPLPSPATPANSLYPPAPGINITIPSSVPEILLNYRTLPRPPSHPPLLLPLNNVQSILSATIGWIDARTAQLGPAGGSHTFEYNGVRPDDGYFVSKGLDLRFGRDWEQAESKITLREARHALGGLRDAAESRGWTEEVRVGIYEKFVEGVDFSLGWVELKKAVRNTEAGGEGFVEGGMRGGDVGGLASVDR